MTCVSKRDQWVLCTTMILHISTQGDIGRDEVILLEPASTITSGWMLGLSQIRLYFSLIQHCLSPSLSFLLNVPAGEGPSWSCDFVGAYHSLVPECCCFSADGSLLAVSFQEVVTVWSPASWELLTTLSQPPRAIRSEHKHALKYPHIH